MSETKLCIATPMYGGMVHAAYMRSLMNLFFLCASKGIQTSYIDITNESLIPRARNVLATMFLKESDFTHLMFIDADIQFDANDVIKMLEADKDVICGVYPKKEMNWNFIEQAVKNGVETQNLQYFVGSSFVNVKEGAEQSITDPVEITDGGTGFMLIKRDVLQKVVDDAPTFWSPEGKEYYAPFDTSFEEKVPGKKEYLSEDFHFCRLVTKAGSSIYAAPWAVLNHIGQYTYSGAFGRTPSTKYIVDNTV